MIKSPCTIEDPSPYDTLEVTTMFCLYLSFSFYNAISYILFVSTQTRSFPNLLNDILTLQYLSEDSLQRPSVCPWTVELAFYGHSFSIIITHQMRFYCTLKLIFSHHGILNTIEFKGPFTRNVC